MTTDRADIIKRLDYLISTGAPYDTQTIRDAREFMATPDRDRGFAAGIAAACDVLWKERLAQAEANNAAWVECTPTIGLAIEKALHDAENLIRQLAARPGVGAKHKDWCNLLISGENRTATVERKCDCGAAPSARVDES